MGVIGIQTSERNGQVVGAAQVIDDDDLLLITNGGTMVRTPCQDISVLGRNTQGVTMIRLTEGEQLVRVDAVSEPPVDPLSESEIESEDEVVIDESDVETGDESAD
jgi:DNA gyrase subunit A